MRTVFVVDLATPKLAEAIHEAGYQAGALILWHDRVTPSAWTIDAAGYDVQLRMDLKKNSLDEIEAALRKAAPDIAGIIPTNEPSEEAASRLAERFGLPHNDPDIAAIRWHKAKCKELVAKAGGLRVPKTKICFTKKDIRDFAKELSFPIIIKTPAGAASINVYKCRNLKDLLEKHHIIVTTVDDFGKQPDHSVIEEYIGGKEYQISMFSNGKEIIVTDVWETETIDTQFATNLLYSASLISPSDPELAQVVEYAIAVTRATGVIFGPGYMQIKVDGKGPALIETHARFGGGSLPDIVRALSSFDPFAATVEVFTKGSTILPNQLEFSHNFAIVFCPSVWNCKKGRTVGIEEIRRFPSFYRSNPKSDTDLYSVQPTTNIRNIPLVVWLRGNDVHQLHEDTKKVHELFHIQCS